MPSTASSLALTILEQKEKLYADAALHAPSFKSLLYRAPCHGQHFGYLRIGRVVGRTR